MKSHRKNEVKHNEKSTDSLKKQRVPTPDTNSSSFRYPEQPEGLVDPYSLDEVDPRLREGVILD